MGSVTDWQSIAAAKRETLQKLVASQLPADVEVPAPAARPDGTAVLRELLAPSALQLTDDALQHGVEALVHSLATRKQRAVDVVGAFVQRAALAHALTNCLSEVLFDDALRRARELDAELERTGAPVGPLHGLPISLKDQFRVQGAETSLGYVGWLGHVESGDEESQIVRDLRALGAVVLCKTSVPASLMAMETHNNIVGTTVAPHNRLLSPGGSSGGEAALLALGGSMLGFGSDVAASIRLPASLNGLCGLKPSVGRLSYAGVANSLVGQEINPSVVGPMGHRIEDLDFVTRHVLAREPWRRDPRSLPIPWRQSDADAVHRQAARRQLKFAVLADDGIVKPLPPVARVMDETVASLRQAGHTVVEWKPPHHGEAFALLIAFFLHDGGRDIHAQAASSGEPLIPQLAAYYGAEPSLPVKSIHDVWRIINQRDAFQAAYNEYWQSTAAASATGRPVDFVLMPCTPIPGFAPEKSMYMGYTGVVNVLDYTAVAIPAGTSRATDAKVSRESYYGDTDKAVWEQYEPTLLDAAPIGLQIMGGRLEEERVLAAAAEVERCLSARR